MHGCHPRPLHGLSPRPSLKFDSRAVWCEAPSSEAGEGVSGVPPGQCSVTSLPTFGSPGQLTSKIKSQQFLLLDAQIISVVLSQVGTVNL